MVRYMTKDIPKLSDRAFDNVFKLLNIAVAAETIEDGRSFSLMAIEELRRARQSL